MGKETHRKENKHQKVLVENKKQKVIEHTKIKIHQSPLISNQHQL